MPLKTKRTPCGWWQGGVVRCEWDGGSVARGSAWWWGLSRSGDGEAFGTCRKTRRKSFLAATMAVVVGIRPVVVAGKFRREGGVNKVQVMGTLDGRLLNNTPGISYSAGTMLGVIRWYQSQGYREPEPEHPDYHVPSDDDIQVEDQPHADDALPECLSQHRIHLMTSDFVLERGFLLRNSIDYPDEPEDGEEDDDEDLEEDPSEEHVHEHEDDGYDVDTGYWGLQRHLRIDESALTHGSLRTRRLTLLSDAATPIPPTSPAYDQAPLGHRAAMIRMRDDIPEEDMPPMRRFVLTAPSFGCDVAESYAAAARAPRGQGLIRSPGHDARTIARAADIVEDVGYVRALQASEHRMMTSIEKVNLRVSYQTQVRRQESEDFYTQLHDARTDRRDIRLRMFVVRAGTSAYETDMVSGSVRVLWMMQSEVDAFTHVLEARAQIDMVEDTGSSCVVGTVLNGYERWISIYISGCAIDNQVKFATRTRLGAALTCLLTAFSKNTSLMCTKFLAHETEKIDKYISGIPDNNYRIVMSAKTQTLDDATRVSPTVLMDQKLRTYAERHNDNKRKADDSSRNNQQPHKKKNVARAYTAGLGENKAYTVNLPLCTKCNYHHTGTMLHQMLETTRGACYECGNTGHIKKNWPKLKNYGNGNGNGTAQGRAYALGDVRLALTPNVITGYVSPQQSVMLQFCLIWDMIVIWHYITRRKPKTGQMGTELGSEIVRDFLKFFLKTLPGYSTARQ
ncbi:hypothetical protein Tco_0534699 [Tanacetum coccineum]